MNCPSSLWSVLTDLTRQDFADARCSIHGIDKIERIREALITESRVPRDLADALAVTLDQCLRPISEHSLSRAITALGLKAKVYLAGPVTTVEVGRCFKVVKLAVLARHNVDPAVGMRPTLSEAAAMIRNGVFPAKASSTLGRPDCTFSSPDVVPASPSVDVVVRSLGLDWPKATEVVIAEFDAGSLPKPRFPTVLDSRGYWLFKPAPPGSPTGVAVSPRGVLGFREVVHPGIRVGDTTLRYGGHLRNDWWD